MDGDLSLIRNMLKNKNEQKEQPVFEQQDTEIGNIKIYKDERIVIDSKYNFKSEYNYNIPVSFEGFDYKAEELKEGNFSKAVSNLKVFLNNKDQILEYIYKTVINFFEGSEDDSNYNMEDFIKIEISATANVNCSKDNNYNDIYLNVAFAFVVSDNEESGYADIRFDTETLSLKVEGINYF
ncbi:MAG: hypothetical protein IKN63_03110 [Bacilli bacterium]|nr:hypothetical protein [Bacilli bacterium]